MGCDSNLTGSDSIEGGSFSSTSKEHTKHGKDKSKHSEGFDPKDSGEDGSDGGDEDGDLGNGGKDGLGKDGLSWGEEGDKFSLSDPTKFRAHTNCSEDNGRRMVGGSVVDSGLGVKLVAVNGGETITLNDDLVESIKGDLMSNLSFEIKLPAEDGEYVLLLCKSGSNCSKPKTPSEAGESDIENYFEEHGQNGVIGLSRDAFRIKDGEVNGNVPEIWVVLDTVREDAGEDQCTGNNSSPLILAMDGSAIELSSPHMGVRFDVEANGQAPQISWVSSASDMFLALDKNGNGTIDSGNELFGNHSVGPNGGKQANGFLALGQYDNNNDGQIDLKDPVFKDLRLWSDANFNGKTDPGELHPLTSKKIESIAVSYSTSDKRDAHGNLFRETSIATLELGKQVPVVDVWFRLPAGVASK
jgi:hypothetical protein